MRVIVLGGGVVGVTAAYQLQRDGHEVVVVERNREVAAGASWGNAGMIAPGHSFVWSSPRAPIILAKSLLLKDQALRFKLSADPRLYAWTWGFIKECTAAKARRNTLLKHRLAAYSQTVLDSVVGEERIDYDRSLRGILYLHRSQKALDAGVEHMKLLESDGQVIKVLDREQVIALEPGFAHAKDKIAGAILCPTDETGDCAKFTRALADLIVKRGGAIVTGATVGGLKDGGRQGHSRGDQPRPLCRRRLCPGARRGEPRSRARSGHPPAHLSDQGLFADDSRLARRLPRRRSPASTNTISSPFRGLATVCGSPRPPSSPAMTRATSRPTSPS